MRPHYFVGISKKNTTDLSRRLTETLTSRASKTEGSTKRRRLGFVETSVIINKTPVVERTAIGREAIFLYFYLDR